MDFILEERVEKACDLFRQGYNCSQSVFLAYNDLLGVESTLAATISGPLGGRHGTAAGGVRGCERHVAHRRFPRTLPRSGRPAGQSRDLRARTGVRRAVPRRERCDRLPRTAGARLPQGRNPCLRNGRPNITKSAPASNSSLVRPVLWGSTCNGRTLRRKSSCGRTLCLRSARPICRSSAIRHGFSSDFQSAGESGVYSAGKSRDSKHPSRHVSTLTPSR